MLMKKPCRFAWLLPAAFALPIVAIMAVLVARYGSDLLDLMMVALKMVVIA